jgi:hypothetical protein
MLAASQPVSAEIFTAATTAQDTTPRQGIFARLSKAVKTVGKGSVPVDAGATASATASKNTSIRSFTMWDVLEIPGSVDTLSVEKVAEHLRKFFGVDLESVSWGDLPLFAGYMESVEERFTSPLGALLERAMTSDDDELDSEGFTDDRSTDGGSQDTASDRETLARMYKSAKQRGFVDLEVL